MTDPSDDDTRFWDQPEWVRTGPVDRVASGGRTGSFERTRTHRVVGAGGPPTTAMTFDDFAPEDDDAWVGVDQWVEPLEDHRRSRFVGIDPRLVRIGAVGMVGVLMIPIAMALRDDSGDGLRSDDVAGVPATASPDLLGDPATTVVTVPITAAAIAPVTVPTAPAPSTGSAGQAPVAAAIAAAPAEPECAGKYTVIANDFWNRFPTTSGASAQEWLNANGATAETPLYVGDELCIPVGATAPAPPPPTTTQPPATTASPTAQAPAPTQAPAPPPAVPPPVTAPLATQPPAPTVPVPTPGPVSGATDPATVEAIIRQIWPDDVEERALAIAKRESGLRPWVSNYCCYGVFAIYFEMGRNWLPGLGITTAGQLFDARTNIQAAYHLYTLAGWQPWAQTDPG